ncbi:carbamoyl-phosphate synthase large subunit [Spirochaeta isovalerica]|uniref:Carbamoyl phosphate synthase arginine-specific large chain, chloroplastic n=1 Tax=Spirochaeta isovalerica TaxID=150 RepID=A0A841R7U2_9SPIO|nr:carbamoyl-phosphate synthase large subunit [Spirochaeta isovalerica]MBB6479039.1 carbamoyl-phosphate synthase large subunit [Spirochaeta isovalerica]
MPADKSIKKILIIGSGPIVIGQACEFDYSGTQAVKSLKKEGYEVILVNPNPATVMTTPGTADKIYIEPLSVPYVEKIIEEENPDAILSTMGGQTALNLTLALDKAGVLKKHNVKIIGANIEAINLAEDRRLFKEVVAWLGLESAKSTITGDRDEAVEMGRKWGYPLVVRPSFTLGGMGGAIASSEEELISVFEKALIESPVGEALIEECLIGWKEFEMEVMRDKGDNAIIVCSIENIDPMGVHTGDSITIAPIQTLSDSEYQKMRTASIDILRAVGVDCGGANVQFAVDPVTGRQIVIEMNPRVSRSSALASKATGFPIASCSAQLAVGYTLDEIVNEITGKSVSCFEPALDYCAVKVPRFETEKFPLSGTALGTQMRSVGEALAIGRTAEEALNKAICAAEIGFEGIEELSVSDEEINTMLTTANPFRILAAYTVLKKEGSGAMDKLNEITGFDKWFLHMLSSQVELENSLASSGINGLDEDLLMDAKRMGLTDKRIGKLVGVKGAEIKALRKSLDMKPSYHFVDTCAGEFTAETPYFYSTWGEIDEGGSEDCKKVVIISSGPNRIGQGLEFDTCCTLASKAWRNRGYKTIMVNSNPETVSTDYNVSDRLYLEPLSNEHVISVIEKEKAHKVVVQLGGQTPLNMAGDLLEAGAELTGTSLESINTAEDRKLFAAMLDKLNLKQPRNKTALTNENVIKFAHEIGYPVLLRPSFVLGGKSMFIAYNDDELNEYLSKAVRVSEESPLLVDQFLEDAFEYDLDAVADGENIYVGGILQHIEAAGIHSGDSACVIPPYKSKDAILREMERAAWDISRELNVQGFLNIQFAVKDDVLYIIEVNPRASRTVPFLSKVTGVDLVDAAVKVWDGENLKKQKLVDDSGIARGECITGWAVKEAVFSFDRFTGQDPILGPEMKSTGEAAGTGSSFGEAFAKAQIAVNTHLPSKGRVYVSVNKRDRETILPVVKEFIDMGFDIAATRGTADFLFSKGIFAEVILKIHEGHPNVVDHMAAGRIDLLINTPMGQFSQYGDTYIRAEAVRRKIPYTTTTSAAQAAVKGIEWIRKGALSISPLPDFRK